MVLSVYFDGAARLGESCGYGYWVKDDQDLVLQSDYGPIAETGYRATCNVAEHYALNKALEWLLENGHQHTEIHVFGDSKMVINQIFGHWRVKDPSKPYVPYCLKNKDLRPKFTKMTGKHVRRHLNEEADRLSKLGIALTE